MPEVPGRASVEPKPSPRAASPAREEQVVFRSDLGLIRLASILQLAESESYTGAITVGDDGRVELHLGHVVAGRVGARLSGVPAVLELLARQAGPVVLALDATITGTPLARTLSLVMDGARLIDEWREIATARWTLRAEPEDLDPAARRMVKSLVNRMATGATLEDASDLLGLARVSVCNTLRALIDRGLVVEASQAPASPPPPTPTAVGAPAPATPPPPSDDVDGLVEQARRLIRSGALADAERLLVQALDARPNDRVIAQNLRHVQLKLERA